MNEGEFVGLTSGRFCSVGGHGSHVILTFNVPA